MFLSWKKEETTKLSAMRRFNEALTELFDGIDQLFHSETIEKETLIKLYTYIWYLFCFLYFNVK